MPKKKTDDVTVSGLTAWGSVLFAALFVYSVALNVDAAVAGTTNSPNSYALLASLVLIAWNLNTARRLRVSTLVAVVMLLTAGFIWMAGLHGLLQ